MATLTRTQPNQELFERTVKALERPSGVGPARIEIRSDHSGDLAAYIRFRVARSIRLDRVRVKALATFANTVTSALFALETGLLFYVRFED